MAATGYRGTFAMQPSGGMQFDRVEAIGGQLKFTFVRPHYIDTSRLGILDQVATVYRDLTTTEESVSFKLTSEMVAGLHAALPQLDKLVADAAARRRFLQQQIADAQRQLAELPE
jgi:hypothetical protein